MTIEAAVAGLKWASVAKIAGQGITWTITLVVLRILDPGDYGVVAVAAVFVTLLGSIAELGLGAALIQARSIADAESGRIAAAALVLNVACAAVIVVASPLLGIAYDDPRIGTVAAVSSLTLVFSGIATVPESFLYREMRFKHLALIDVTAATAASLATLALALSDWGIWSLVLGPLAGSAVRCIALLRFSRWVRPKFALDGITHHLRFGGALTAGRFAWQGAQQCDVLIGGRFLSEAVLGMYSVSVHLARMPMSKMMSVINQVAFPAVARMQDAPRWLAGRLIEAIGLLGFLTVPLLWGLSSVAPEFVAVVMGEEWTGAALPLQLITLSIPVQMLSNVFSTTLAGLGCADVEFRNMLTALGVTVLSVLLGVMAAGAAGLAAGLSVAAVLVLVLNFHRTNRVLGLSIREGVHVLRGPVIAGASMYAAVMGARVALAQAGDLVRFVVLVATGAVVYLLVVRMFDSRSWHLLRRAAGAARAS